MSIAGKPRAALVTGASKGIGLAIAERIAAAGYRLMIVARSIDVLTEYAVALGRRHGADVRPHGADLSDAAAAAGAVDIAVRGFGGIDLLVNCAGATKAGDFLSLTHQDFVDGFALKFHGAVNLTRAAWPHLVQSGSGHVINIIGIRAKTPAAGFTIGGPVNSALFNFTKAMAERGIADGVRVNGVSPGFIRTDRIRGLIEALMARDDLSEDAASKRMLAEHGVRRFGTADEVAAAVLFLDQAGSGYINGAVIDVDGGLTKGM